MTRIGEIRRGHGGLGGRVSADVDGQPLWFESDEVELSPQPEAFASALLVASIHRNRPITIDAPVSSTWAENVERLTGVWSSWWGYRVPQIDFNRRADETSRKASTALAFTAGVDSFYSLLFGPQPELLVSVHGFDVALADAYRMARFESSTRAVASELGMQAVVVRTNLREHRAMGPRRLWERAHGGGVAAIGHLLGGSAGSFVISSTYASYNERPWGSSGVTDPLFSSDRVSITQFGGDRTRDGKMSAIAEHPLVQKHLRVCWENRAKAGNCSRCGKCLAAMLILAEVQLLDKFTVFDGMNVLAARVDELPHLKNNINIVQRIVNRGQLPRDIDAALRRLIVRSRRAAVINSCRQRVRDAIFPRG